jgi:diguanylate cyclase (GGDEF)-like protein
MVRSEGSPVDQSGHANILIVDDSRTVREEIKAALRAERPGLSFLEAENGLDGFKLLVDHHVDLILCDLVMPRMDGFKFLQLRASRTDLLGVPVIVLTAVDQVDQKIRLLSAGASDYLTKPFHPGELVARTMVHLNIKLLQDELQRKNALLLELSTTDGLTRIYTRRHFLELAQAEFDRSDRLDLSVALMVLDVDHFKEINDGLGHQVGDEVLVGICQTIKRSLRDYDLFGRHGGDEFTLLFPETTKPQALAIGTRLEADVRAMRLECLHGVPLSFSGGIAWRKGAGTALEDVLRAADRAMYEAKRLGRGRVVAL